MPGTVEVPIEVENLHDLKALPSVKQVEAASKAFRDLAYMFWGAGVPLDFLMIALEGVSQRCGNVKHGKCDWEGVKFGDEREDTKPD